MNSYHGEGTGRFKPDEQHPLRFEQIIPGAPQPIDFETALAPLHLRLGRIITDSLVVVNPMQDLSAYERRAIRNAHPESDAYVIRPGTYYPGSSEGVVPLNYGEVLVTGRSYSSKQGLGEFSTNVSRKHALIQLSSTKELTVHDYSSTNGTFTATGYRIYEAPTLPVAIIPPETFFQPQPERFSNVQSYTSSIAAESHPTHNEDAFIADDRHHIYGVFDGVGGSANGQLASRIAADVAMTDGAVLRPVASLETQGDALARMLIKANSEIISHRQEAQTTAVVMNLHSTASGEQYATIASCGDSRAYLIRNGVLTALTTDHTPYRTQHGKDAAKESQLKLAATDSMSDLSESSARLFRSRNVVGAVLGYEHSMENTIDIEHVRVQPGDVLVLTTDGIHDNLSDPEIESLLNRSPSHRIPITLTQAALTRSRLRTVHDRAKPDDMTAVAVEI